MPRRRDRLQRTESSLGPFVEGAEGQDGGGGPRGGPNLRSARQGGTCCRHCGLATLSLWGTGVGWGWGPGLGLTMLGRPWAAAFCPFLSQGL